MLLELRDYASRHKASVEALYYWLYSRFRSLYPWLPTMFIIRCIRDAAMIAGYFSGSKDRQHTWEMAGEIIGYLGLKPKKEDRHVIKEL